MGGRLFLGAAVAVLVLSLLGCSRDGTSPSAPEPKPRAAPAAPTEPTVAGGTPGLAQGEALYKQFCSTCHGPEGKGNGPAAAGLPVKPADHTDGRIMNKISDAELFKAIKEGGPAVGKSTAMPPWGGSLKDEQIRAVVLYVRNLAKPR